MSSQAALLFISGPLAGKGKKLKNEITVIGRSSSCDICISDASISREHAKIFLEKGIYTIKDLGSHNGIKVNDSKLDQLILKNGLRFRLGTAEIEFWDGVGASPNNNQEAIVSEPIDVVPGEFKNIEKAPSSRLAEMKQKRFTNLLILFSIIGMVSILCISFFVFMNKTERPIQYSFLKMYTDEEKVIDLSFKPMGENERLLKPFRVSDYKDFTTSFQNIYLNKDIFIKKEVDLVAPPIGNVILIKTKYKVGQGQITFYIKEKEELKTIGILTLNVIRRPVPEIINNFLNAEIEIKKNKADELYSQILKYENDPNRKKDIWNLLKVGKELFENGDAKPEIYTKLDDKFTAINKTVELNNKKLFDQFDLAKTKKNWELCAKILAEIIQINPDDENLYRQKAVLYS